MCVPNVVYDWKCGVSQAKTLGFLMCHVTNARYHERQKTVFMFPQTQALRAKGTKLNDLRQ
jgi:hypothetical protein